MAITPEAWCGVTAAMFFYLPMVEPASRFDAYYGFLASFGIMIFLVMETDIEWEKK